MFTFPSLNILFTSVYLTCFLQSTRGTNKRCPKYQVLNRYYRLPLTGQGHFSLRNTDLLVCLAVLVYKILLSLCLTNSPQFQFALLDSISSLHFQYHWNVFKNSCRTIFHCCLDQQTLPPIQHHRLPCWDCLSETPVWPLNTHTGRGCSKKPHCSKAKSAHVFTWMN